MKKSQRQLAGAVANADQQISPATIYDLRQQHFTADERTSTRLKRSNFNQAGAIFVAVGQKEQQVFQPAKAESGKLCVERRADARENG